MSAVDKIKHIGVELRGHAPFTFFGASIGIVFMLIFKDISKAHAEILFWIFHPSHVVLSAMVTASLFELHRKAKNFLLILVIGYVGSIGIATLSDCVIPYIGESLFGLHIPSHAEAHHGGDSADEQADEGQLEDDEHQEGHEHSRKMHLGFIEQWYIVNPAAILGVLIAYFLPRTKFPHALHVLISTWASSAHILMNTEGQLSAVIMAGILGVLFVAVWVPCCISDIVFPLLFVNSDLNVKSACAVHKYHSHRHIQEGAEAKE